MKTSKNKVIEEMRTIWLNEPPYLGSAERFLFKIRLWIKANNIKEIDGETYYSIFDFIKDEWRELEGIHIIKPPDFANRIAEKFKDELAAVEMVDCVNDGVVIYPDWN